MERLLTALSKKHVDGWFLSYDHARWRLDYRSRAIWYCRIVRPGKCLMLEDCVSPYPALIVIDLQKAFDDPTRRGRNNPDAESRIAYVLAAWRGRSWPVLHVQHASLVPNSPFRADQPGFAFKEEGQPRAGEAVIRKNVNCAFIGTDLESRLRTAGIKSVVIVGLTTPHCVSTTARIAGNLGFETFVVSDATAAFDWPGLNGQICPAEQMHQNALIALHGEFATILNTAELSTRFFSEKISLGAVDTEGRQKTEVVVREYDGRDGC